MNSEQTMVKMVLDRWHSLLGNFNTTLNAMSDEQLQKEIAPGKNRGIYLLGHLTAAHDNMIPLLDFGNKLFPELNPIFLDAADKTIAKIPSASQLKASFNQVNDLLAQKFRALQPHEWFEKHTSVSAEDFAKEPHRNKLNIVITRTSHLSYHTGQFILLK